MPTAIHHDPHHAFSLDLATKFSVEEAILIQHFQHWIGVNRRLKQNFHDGRYWTYQTLEWIAGHFPYWSGKQVERLVKKLTDKGILIKGNYNKLAYDRTVWYAFSEQEIDFPKSGNGDSEIGRPIPDTLNTYTKTELPKGSIGAPPRTPPPPNPNERAENVKTTAEEHEKLLKAHGEEKTRRLYQRLSDWKKDTPKSRWKKNDYRSILRWVVAAEDDAEKRSRGGSPLNARPSVDRTMRDENGQPVKTGKEGMF